MNKGLSIAVAALVLCFGVALGTLFAGGKPGEIGRFNLVAGEYQDFNYSTRESRAVKTFFKIDTATGDVWDYRVRRYPDGKVSREWASTLLTR